MIQDRKAFGAMVLTRALAPAQPTQTNASTEIDGKNAVNIPLCDAHRSAAPEAGEIAGVYAYGCNDEMTTSVERSERW
jgi:hypothetical protein